MSSSGGALLSLAAQGPQDVFLTGNPNTNYFHQVYRRHSNFATAEVRQPIEGAIANGSLSKFQLSRQGDMVSYIYLRDPNTSGVPSAYDMLTQIDYVTLKIGGQEIVKMTQMNLREWQLILANQPAKVVGPPQNIAPLNFWFCDYWGASLPLCALQYHDVVVEVKWALNPTNPPPASSTVNNNIEAWAKMVWLDNTERQKFVQAPKLTYIIDQWQNSDPIGLDTRNRMDLNFNHPVKTLIVPIGMDEGARSNVISLTTSGIDISKLAEDQMIASAYWHCPNARSGIIPAVDGTPIIPFALNLGTNQPCGSLNFSRLENVQLSCEPSNFLELWDNACVTAVNSNLLIIKNGMGGLSFSN